MSTPKLTVLIGILGILAGAAGRLLLPPGSPAADRLPARAPDQKAVKSAAKSWQLSLTAAMRLPPGLREEAQVQWADAVPEDDILEAIRLLDSRRDRVQLQVLLCRWAAKDPLAALAAWRTPTIPISGPSSRASAGNDGGSSRRSPRSDIGGAILAAWSRRDPAAAGAWAMTVEGDAEWRALAFPIGQAIDRHPNAPVARIAADPSVEGARVLAMPHSEERTNLLRMALRVMADKDPAAGADWVDSWPEETRRRMGVYNLDWPLLNAPASVRARVTGDQLRRLPPEQLRDLGSDNWGALSDGHETTTTARYTSRALFDWTIEDPTGSRVWLEAVEEPGLHAALSGVAASAVRERDGLAAAVELLNALPEEQQTQALLPFVRDWARADAPAAAAWLNRIDDASCRDACLAALSLISSRSDPVWALTQSSQIQDAAKRTELQNEILRDQEVRAAAVKSAWRAVDPQAPEASQ